RFEGPGRGDGDPDGPGRQLRGQHPLLRRAHDRHLPLPRPARRVAGAAMNEPGEPHAADSLRAALERRASVRGFSPEPLGEEDLRALFAMAQRAPSWCNIQPWRVWVTAPPRTAEVSRALTDAARAGLPAPDVPFPGIYPEPYLAHRRACGFALYQAMGIGRD